MNKHLLILLLSILLPTSGYKILVVPFPAGFNSRFLNFLKLADILATDHHKVSLLISSTMRSNVTSKNLKVIEFTVPQKTKTVNDVSQGDKKPSWNPFARINLLLTVENEFCRHIISNTNLMSSLEDTNFDLYIGDMYSACSVALAAYFNITTMWYLNFPLPALGDVFYPQFPSFTCQMPGAGCISDDMDFIGRVKNFVMKLFMEQIFSPIMRSVFSSLLNEYCRLKTSMIDAVKGKVVVINMDFILDSPLPLMPHVVPISGLLMEEKSPLPADIEAIVTTATNGVILLSFGLYVPAFDSQKAEMLARVFGQLPQTILWRNTGVKPKSLQPNTHVLDWFPQNDLLARPEVKLLITHCGISSVFETAYHGVPVVAMPLNTEQKFHAMKLIKKVGAGIQLDYHSLKEDELFHAIKEVLENPVYKDNIKKTSDILNDKVVSPRQQFRHLVNFTIKSEGAPHLFHPYAAEMNWFQFYALDVILFIVTIAVFLTLSLAICLKLSLKNLIRCFRGTKSKTA